MRKKTLKKEIPNQAREGIIYARVSSVRQTIDGSGLQSQEARCIEELKKINVPHVKSFLDSFTGGGDYKKRPEMMELFKYIDSHPDRKYVVIFDDIKRFARDTQNHILLRNEFKKRDVELRCLSMRLEDTPEGTFVETVMAAGGQLEREQNKRQVVDKMTARLKAGYWTFGTKIGYRMVKDKAHGKIAVPIEGKAEILKEALEGFAKGVFQSKVDACRYMTEKGFWKQRGEKYVHVMTKLLQNPFYAGYIEYPHWGVERIRGNHKPLISEETFELIQKRLSNEGMISTRPRKDTSEDFPLRGLLVCGDCGGNLTGSWNAGRSKHYPYYICTNRKGCPSHGKSAKRADVEDGFNRILKQQRLKSDVEKVLKKSFERAWKHEVHDFSNHQSRLEKEKGTLEKKIKGITELAVNAKSDVARRSYEGQIEEMALKIEEISGKLVQKEDLSIPYQTALDKATGLLKKPHSIWQTMNAREKHELYPFIFEEKLAYSQKTGYQTDNIPYATGLFEDFTVQNTMDVEMGGIEPPCMK